MDCEILQMDALLSTSQVMVGGNRFGTDGNEGHNPYNHLHHGRVCHCLHHPHHYQPLLLTSPAHKRVCSLEIGAQRYVQLLCIINFFAYKKTL